MNEQPHLSKINLYAIQQIWKISTQEMWILLKIDFLKLMWNTNILLFIKLRAWLMCLGEAIVGTIVCV
jgi:hypothetical protein